MPTSCRNARMRILRVRRAAHGCLRRPSQESLAFGGLHLVDTHVEEADGIALEALALWPFDFAQESLVTFDVGRREMPCRWRHWCSADHVRCGIDGCNA